MSVENNKHYEKIYTSALKLISTLTPEETYKVIVNEGRRLINAKHGSIFLEDGKSLTRVYSTSPVLWKITPREKGHTAKVYEKKKPYILSLKKAVELHPELKKLHIGSDVGVPLIHRNKTFGVLSLLSPTNASFTKEDLTTLQLFAPIASLAIRNAQLYAQLQKSLEERDLFISIAAHEFKTPLTTISVYSQLLLRKNQHVSSEPHIKMKLLSEVNRLANLVNELFQINQVKTGNLKFTMRKCDLRAVLERSVAAFESMYPNTTIMFRDTMKQSPCHVYGDANKLLQAITNLLNNATKFSPKNKPITVTLAYKDSYYCITIADKGLGIKKKDLPQIFDRFYKATAQKEGLGLGLYLVKNIIDHHSGEITVSSVRNKGTTFSLSLPIYRNSE